jgi:hypothetical protein
MRKVIVFSCLLLAGLAGSQLLPGLDAAVLPTVGGEGRWLPKVEVVFFCEEDGTVPFVDWLAALPSAARAKCLVRLDRLEELDDRVGTTASVISRLEDDDYAGHSLAMLRRIATALNKRVEIRFVPLRSRAA